MQQGTPVFPGQWDKV